MSAAALTRDLVVSQTRALKLPGVQIAETTFEPQGAVFSGETCRGGGPAIPLVGGGRGHEDHLPG